MLMGEHFLCARPRAQHCHAPTSGNLTGSLARKAPLCPLYKQDDGGLRGLVQGLIAQNKQNRVLNPGPSDFRHVIKVCPHFDLGLSFVPEGFSTHRGDKNSAWLWAGALSSPGPEVSAVILRQFGNVPSLSWASVSLPEKSENDS